MGFVPVIMQGCASLNTTPLNAGISPQSVRHYVSVQDLIVKQQLNQSNTQPKEYVYDWGPTTQYKAPQSLLPKHYLSAYCEAKNGKFSLKHKSRMDLVKDKWAKKLLMTYGAVTQGIGVFQCIQKDGTRWMVSVEPVSERKRDANQDTRVVALQTKVISASEAQRMYTGRQVLESSVQNRSAVTAPVVVPVKATPVKPVEVKAEEEKPQPTVAPQTSRETVQQQQQRLYLGARRDILRGQNQLAACSQADRAYRMGRFYNSSGPNIYAESGILVAKCLTTVSAYQQKFMNPKARAKTILQGLVNTQNHAVAKHMLQQLK